MRTKRRSAGCAVAHEAEGNPAAPAQNMIWAVPLGLAGGGPCAQRKWLGLAHGPVNSSIAGLCSSNMASAHLLEQPRSSLIVDYARSLLAWPQQSRQWCASQHHPDLSALHCMCPGAKQSRVGEGSSSPCQGRMTWSFVCAASARLRPRRLSARRRKQFRCCSARALAPQPPV